MSKVKSFQGTWPFIRAEIIKRVGDNPTGESLFRLGDQLSEIFLAVPGARASAAEAHARSVLELDASDDDVSLDSIAGPTATRTQSDVSTGGVVWECLVAWYLNLMSYGTDVIAARRTKENTPEVITDAISVTLHGYSTTTESDVVVYTATGVPPGRSGKVTIKDVDAHIKKDTQNSSVAIVQCKTNWNDNAQIPMLWDLIYRSLPFVQVSSIALGRRGVTPRSFKGESVKYAFVTVPTNQKSTYKAGSVPVTRVLGLSGGNYWGKPTEQGVATSFAEFLTNNFSAYFKGSVANHIDREMASNPGLLDQFLELDFIRAPFGDPTLFV